MVPERPLAVKNQPTQNPLSQGQTLNAATDALQAVQAFEITIDSLASDYKDGHFLSREGPNLDTAMMTRQQLASSMRVFQVNRNPEKPNSNRSPT